MEDLEALKATIGGFHIGKNSIYSGNKKTIDSTERGIYFDSNGQSYFGDNKNFIRFYRSDKDNYKLQVSADSLTFGSGVSVEKAFEDIKGDIQNAQGTADAAKEFTDNAKHNFGYQYKAELEVAGDANTYYPVMIYGGDQDVMREILIKRSWIDKAPEAWNGHPTTHGISCTCKIKCNFGGWGGTKYDWRIHELQEGYGQVFAGCEIHRDGMFFFIFLRGGGATYTLYSDQEMNRIPEYYHTTVTEAPSIWYNGGLIGWSGGTEENPNYTFYAPQPRTYTADVIKEIHDRTYIKVATDAYDKAGDAMNTANQAQGTADSAQTSANQAQSTANKAQSSADKAQGAADTAQSTANKAQNAADTAQSTANKARNTANKAQTAINNLEIGGRNLVTNSKNLKNFKNESSSYISMIFTDTDVTVTGTKNLFGIYYDISVEGVSYYTLSFNAADISGICKCSVGGDDTSIWSGLRNYITLEAGRTEVTFKTNAATTVARIYFSCHSGSDSFRLWNVKLEKGNKATDWTPAPEDVDAGITDAQTAADEALKGTKENAAQMAQMVTDFNGDIKNLQDQIDGNITT